MTDHADDGARCRRCPLAPDAPCAGVDIRRLCQLVDPEHPDHDPAYKAVLTTTDRPRPDAVDADEEPPPRRPLHETLRLLRAMKSCPHREERTDCGCAGAASCSRGGERDGLVRIVDCFDCLAPPAPGDAPPPRERIPP